MSNFWTTLPKPIIALAPMAGYTDSAFRILAKEYGADLVYSEMISVDALCVNNQKTLRMLAHSKKEYPLIIQLFGNQPNKFAQATRVIDKKIRSNEVGLDINFGCPAAKVTKTGSGSALMNEIDKAIKIIQAVADNTQLPLSVKIRSKVKNITALKFIDKIKHLPWTTLMVHGRTLNQGFSGPIDYAAIKKIKKLLPDKIVLANGNIHSSQDAKSTLEKTNADGLGIARGAWGRPWLFKEIKTDKVINLAWPLRHQIMLRHAQLFLATSHNLIPLRQQLVHYTKGLKNAAQLRQQLIQVETLESLSAIK